MITFRRLWEEHTQDEAQIIIREREDESNQRPRSHDPKKIPQVMRNMKNLICEEPLIHLKHLDKK